MKHLARAGILIAVLAVSACANTNPFGAGGAGADAAAGSVADPTSPAYFQQAVGDRVLFAVDQSTLSSEARDTLRRQAVWLNDNPAFSAIIEGHADEQGTREYNLALGARRASAVQNFLIAQGVDPRRLRTVSYGKERPIAICSDEACYAQNRRAVTVLTAGGMG